MLDAAHMHTEPLITQRKQTNSLFNDIPQKMEMKTAAGIIYFRKAAFYAVLSATQNIRGGFLEITRRLLLGCFTLTYL